MNARLFCKSQGLGYFVNQQVYDLLADNPFLVSMHHHTVLSVFTALYGAPLDSSRLSMVKNSKIIIIEFSCCEGRI